MAEAKRKARPVRTKKGEYLRTIDLRITELDGLIEDFRKQKKRYLSQIMGKKSSDLKSVDYSADKVMCSGSSLGFTETLIRLDECNDSLNRLLDERALLKNQRKRLIRLYSGERGNTAKVFFLREVLGYTQEETADKLGYSVRQIQRIERKLREQG